jgi:flagellar basal-body rod modification protein FlgD
MPEISAVGNATNYDPTARAAGNKALGKDEFLNLLVTQLRFQNPLEPLKDTDFIAQLAQFSSLEQLSNINTSLDTSSQLDYILSQTIANTMATTLIGKQVVADGDQIYHAYGDDEELHFDLGADATDIEVKIFDDKGILVRTLTDNDLQKGMNSITWNGKDDTGANVGAGNYTFSVTAKNQAGETVSVQTRRVGIVESVRYEDGQGYLIVDGQKIALSDIIEVNLDGGPSVHDKTDNG